MKRSDNKLVANAQLCKDNEQGKMDYSSSYRAALPSCVHQLCRQLSHRLLRGGKLSLGVVLRSFPTSEVPRISLNPRFVYIPLDPPVFQNRWQFRQLRQCLWFFHLLGSRPCEKFKISTRSLPGRLKWSWSHKIAQPDAGRSLSAVGAIPGCFQIIFSLFSSLPANIQRHFNSSFARF